MLYVLLMGSRKLHEDKYRDETEDEDIDVDRGGAVEYSIQGREVCALSRWGLGLDETSKARTLAAFAVVGIVEALVGGERQALAVPLAPLRPPTLSSSNLRGLALRWVRS